MNAKTKAITNKAFMPLKYEDYSKLSSKEKETYNEGERKMNFERKMRRKGYGVSPEQSVKRLSKYFA